MPRRVFKPLTRQRQRWKASWFMQPFRALLEDPAYWSLNRRNVTRAFALGLFIAFVPLPFSFTIAAVLALLWRLNIPAAIAGTLLSNPLTFVPLFVFAYWVGAKLLSIPPRPIAFELSWDWLTTGLAPIWKPFLLGCAVMGTFSAIVGYVLLASLWHITLVMKYHKRRGTSAGKESENG